MFHGRRGTSATINCCSYTNLMKLLYLTIPPVSNSDCEALPHEDSTLTNVNALYQPMLPPSQSYERAGIIQKLHWGCKFFILKKNQLEGIYNGAKAKFKVKMDILVYIRRIPETYLYQVPRAGDNSEPTQPFSPTLHVIRQHPFPNRESPQSRQVLLHHTAPSRCCCPTHSTGTCVPQPTAMAVS